MTKARLKDLGYKFLIALGITIVISVAYYAAFPEYIIQLRNLGTTVIFYLTSDILCLAIDGVITWEINAKFLEKLDCFVRWEVRPFLRLVVQMVGTSLIAFLVLAVVMFIDAHISYYWNSKAIDAMNYDSILLEYHRIFLFFKIIVLIYHGAYFSGFFYSRWAASLVEVERMKRENIHAQLHTLQNQVNPHFLFNSLNTLTSVIEEDQKQAVEFVQRLANFYRYILQRETEHVVVLSEELNFVKSYIYLQKQRFGEHLQVNIVVSEEDNKKYLPTFALQMLLENAVKHNVVSSEHPLIIEVTSVGNNKLLVRNNLQKKNTMANSTRNGLKNIQNRYRLLDKREISVTEDANYFTVIIPLFQDKGLYANTDC
ncbi:MAG: histidine kinase [Ignavibacteria bacterium]|nr:histidine kinase [Ignavibacteria bacterium]